MNEHSIAQLIQMAAGHYEAARLAEARAICRQILVQEPNHPDALHLLGVIAIQLGQADAAIELIRRAIAINPGEADYHNNFGYALRDKGQLDESIAAWRQAIGLRPDFAEAYNNLGDALRDKGQFDEAISACRRAIGIKPDSAQAYNNLGTALFAKRSFDEAIAAYGRALQFNPNLAEIHSNLGNALRGKKQFNEAIESYRQAIRLGPELAEAHYNLGVILEDVGQLDEAITAYRHAVQLKPDSATAHSNLIFTLHFHPGYDAGMIYEEYRRWNRQFAEPLGKLIQPHTNDRNPDRPLRIGYVSPDFRNHPVGRFLLPLISSHDHDRFMIFCYSNAARSDHLTGLLRNHADQWRSIAGLSDEAAAQLIRQDHIDILLDLSLHTANNRLLVFARKPAPVQVTWLGYPGSTGLTAIDYRLTDPYLDPPPSTSSGQASSTGSTSSPQASSGQAGKGDKFYTERSVHLPNTSLCYLTPERTPEANRLPALDAGHVTFGSFNQLSKLSDVTIELWAEVLKAVAVSRLLIKVPPGRHLDRIIRLIEERGLGADRLEFIGRVGPGEYFSLYHRVDICLDPTPYSGHTTTCDSLWMGVPVVTLRGRTAVGRGGVSILSNVGLTDWIADNPRQYISIAQQMAGDLPKLAELRSTLRQRMLASPLMDAKQFAHDIETAFRQMWKNWCSKQQ